MREGILILRIRKGSDFVENTEKKVQWLKLLFPWILVLAVYALVWLFLGVRYEVNDDATLCNIAAGAYGEESQYLGISSSRFIGLLPQSIGFTLSRQVRTLLRWQFCVRCYWTDVDIDEEVF